MIKNLIISLLLLGSLAVYAQDSSKKARVTEELDVTGADIKGFQIVPPGPTSPTAPLVDDHGATIYFMDRFITVDGDDTNSGRSWFESMRTWTGAIASLQALSGNGHKGRIFFGAGVFDLDPVDWSSLQLNEIQIIGIGASRLHGTELRCSSNFTSTDDLFAFNLATNAHQVSIRNLRIDMLGRGRHAIYMGLGGMMTEVSGVFFANVPGWAIKHHNSAVTLLVENCGAAYCGFGQGTFISRPSWNDVGGGNYHPTFSGYFFDGHYEGQTVRVTYGSGGALPGGLAHHTDYYLVDDNGNLRLSATPAGPPLAATSAGSAVILYAGAAIPDIEEVDFVDIGGGAWHLDNASMSQSWVAGQKVRIRSTANIPTGLAGGTDYWLVDDAGTLRLSATFNGPPLAATSDETGITWLQDAYDPEVHGGFLFSDNDGESSLGLINCFHIQLDACGPYPFMNLEESGSAVSTAASVDFGVNTITRASGSFITDGFSNDTIIEIDNANLEENDGVFYLSNVTTSTLTLTPNNFDWTSVHNTVADSGDTTAVIRERGNRSLLSIRGLETENTVQQGAFVHDAVVALDGDSSRGRTAVRLEDVQAHNSSGGKNQMKSIVKALRAGPPKVDIVTSNVNAEGLQYDWLFMSADEQVLVDLSYATQFTYGSPRYEYATNPRDVMVASGFGKRAGSSQAAYPRYRRLANGMHLYGTGAAHPVDTFSGDGVSAYSHVPFIAEAGATVSGGVLTVDGGNLFLDGQVIVLEEVALAPDGDANQAKIYAIDNGAEKTQLMVVFADDIPQQLAIQP